MNTQVQTIPETCLCLCTCLCLRTCLRRQRQVRKQGPVLVREVITCKCGMEYTVWQKPGEVVCIPCPKCGQTLTAVVPMRPGQTGVDKGKLI